MKMQFIATVLSTALVASAIRVSFDGGYDSADRDLTLVSCSDGSNGLIQKGYAKQGNLPNFPLIGGASVIEKYNSPNCATCWTLTYGARSVTILAIDHADEGFNIAKAALDQLTDNQAEKLGAIDAEYVQVENKQCGL
ncbi:hypothetical protein QTJ16_006588 [Diplocarpon rosae]|uniref:Uncharacterized protein n=1 Tax=Diplocarpon rosae TaxID=946125 RepID=A0AAD9SVM6_9HELO|nr:hypothetical protein QTJ16_006588 [Diplocarpon rosae]PBP15643.1 hypothetical protein BUE80_DR013634 [Diplocarpon rosae]